MNNNRENYSNQLAKFNDEIVELQSFYNLHPIQITNLFNEALKDIYIEEGDKNDYLLYRDKHQIFLYNIPNKSINIKNISLKKYKKLKAKLQEEIYKTSIINENILVVSELANKHFIKCNKYKQSNRNVYFKISKVNKNIQNRIIFKYKIDYFNDNIEYINNINSLWIYVEPSKLKKKLISSMETQDIIINIDIFHYYIIKQITITLLNKIANKTKFKIQLKFIDRNKKEIYLKNNTYMPLTLIRYISKYIYKLTTYSIKLENK